MMTATEQSIGNIERHLDRIATCMETRLKLDQEAADPAVIQEKIQEAVMTAFSGIPGLGALAPQVTSTSKVGG